jgi:predicted alpha/beta-hydrolase family hydrolase
MGITAHNCEPFAADSPVPVRGFLHRPAAPSGDALVLTHGAGSNCQTQLLIAVAEVFAEGGFVVLRCDLPYRQVRPYGPPFRGEAERDREGLRAAAAAALRAAAPGITRLFLGGHSYGGRPASMLAAESPELASGLLLLSYPLHPPRKPSEMRTAHFPSLRTAALFVHGTRDPFASSEEIEAALKLIPAATSLLSIEGAGHDLLTGAKARRAESLPGLAQRIRDALLSLKNR